MNLLHDIASLEKEPCGRTTTKRPGNSVLVSWVGGLGPCMAGERLDKKKNWKNHDIINEGKIS